jgi:hypothetical protein
MKNSKLVPFRFILAIAATLAASAVSGHAQGETASGTVSGVPSGGNYLYTITLENTSASTAIGSFWYSWTPTFSPFFYLPSVPISASAPVGWTAFVDGKSIQFSGGSLAPGDSTNFQYLASFTPSQLTGQAGYSYVYQGGIQTDPGSFLNAQTTSVPEPSPTGLFLLGLLGLLAVNWRRFRAQQPARVRAKLVKTAQCPQRAGKSLNV